jgi:hypothetical protein
MTQDPSSPIKNSADQTKEDSVSRRAIAKKIAYVAPAVLAVISIADRPALAASTGGGGLPT